MAFDDIVQREQGLHRHLSAAQMGMIAIGGAIGTGLFLGSGFAISFAGPGKSEAELMQSVAAGINIHVESQREIDAVARCGDRLGVRPRVTVRINPPFELKASGMRMGGGAKPFGIDSEQVPQQIGRASCRERV